MKKDLAHIRLSKEKIDFVKSGILNQFPDARIYLFGSRVEQTEKGGDIDILVLTEKPLERGSFRELRRGFFKRFGWQKLDIVLFANGEKSVFKDLALDNALKL